jgi:hypothetical protein
MRRAWLIALCGCRSILGIEEASPIARDGDPSDSDGFAFEDALADANVPGQVCFGQAKVKACVNTMPTNMLTLPSIIDTSGASSCTLVQPQAAPPSLCVIVARSIVVPIGSNVRVVGSRPLVLIAADSMTIDGAIDVASHRLGGSGAGANTGACTTAQAGDAGIGGAGGAAGGALGGTGGGGGSGGAGAGAPATAMPATTVLRGGCAGAKGGDAAIGAGGVAGAGGGALYLIANGGLQISGTLNASGAAAGPPGDRGGGGGGGAGGMIGLEAPLITIGAGAQIYAVGGGGSSGGGSSEPGNAGAEAVGPAATATTPGSGQSGTGAAGGAQSSGSPGGVGSTTTGGGGGGGSAGIIWTYPTVPSGGMFAPMPRLP